MMAEINILGTSSNRICQGYQDTCTPGIDRTTAAPVLMRQGSVFSPSFALSTSLPRCESETRSLEFFQLKSLASFNSIFQDDFWSILVLQLAQSEPSIHYALSALSSFHEGHRETFALRQCNMAIRALTRPQHGSLAVSLEVQAISCLIFFNIEVRNH